jgi:hypothetical protein
MDKKSKILFSMLLAVILVSAIVTFYRYIILKDFVVIPLKETSEAN